MMMRKLTVFVLVLAMCISFAACSKDSGTSAATGSTPATASTTPAPTSTPPADTRIFANQDVTLSIMVPDDPTRPYKEDWFSKKAIEEKTNVKLNPMLVESSSSKYNDKFNLLVASNELPDIVFQYNSKQGNIYALQGAFANVENYFPIAPNYKKFIESEQSYAKQLLASDGKLYSFAVKGQGAGNRINWIYRKDIFEKNNLTPPKTPDELYAVAKKLKDLYPDSYPITSRKVGGIDYYCTSWGPQDYTYYDFDKKVFKFGPIQPEYKTFLEFYNKLISDKLAPPDVLTINANTWIDMLVQSKAFITVDYVGRMDTIGESGKAINPEFELAYMPPINGVINFYATDLSCIFVSAKSKNVENAIKLLDWYYSDEAVELLSWGKEGETYKVVNGNREFMETDISKAYGLYKSGFGALFDENAIISRWGEQGKLATKEGPKYELKCNPIVYMQLTEAENEVIATVGGDINKYKAENVALFVLGQKSFSEWDSYVKEIEKMGVAKMLEVYTKAFERYK